MSRNWLNLYGAPWALQYVAEMEGDGEYITRKGKDVEAEEALESGSFMVNLHVHLEQLMCISITYVGSNSTSSCARIPLVSSFVFPR